MAEWKSSHSAGRQALPAPSSRWAIRTSRPPLRLRTAPAADLADSSADSSERVGPAIGDVAAAPRAGTLGVLLDPLLGGEGTLAGHGQDEQDEQTQAQGHEPGPQQPRRGGHRQGSHGQQVDVHRFASIAKSIGSTWTLENSILSRKLGRRPVARRKPKDLASASKPAEWS